jgi:acetoacetate decarboxylase
LRYGKVNVATATMGFKHRPLDLAAVKASLESPGFLLKILPHVDGTPRILELVEYRCKDVRVKGAWTGPVGLDLVSHALAPVADLPVLEIVSGVHILADLTLDAGSVVHDYLADGHAASRNATQRRVASDLQPVTA